MTKLISISFLLIVLITGCNEHQQEETINSAEYSTITCPYCGHSEKEKLPTEVCQFRYECKNCGKELTPEGEDCCVFCTHGDHKCPSKQ